MKFGIFLLMQSPDMLPSSEIYANANDRNLFFTKPRRELKNSLRGPGARPPSRAWRGWWRSLAGPGPLFWRDNIR